MSECRVVPNAQSSVERAAEQRVQRSALPRMRLLMVYLISAVALGSVCCKTQKPSSAEAQKVAATPTPTLAVSWSEDPTDSVIDNEALRLAWKRFEKSQKYRLAKPSDRNLTPAALARTNSNNPSLTWWGTRGYRGFVGKDFLVAIVVDPSRSDSNRFGLVVLAAVASEGKNYKTYWVSREEDMESYLISPASGSVFVECFRRDGSQETKLLTWERTSRQFRLLRL
jgi:hypothetical protein